MSDPTTAPYSPSPVALSSQGPWWHLKRLTWYRLMRHLRKRRDGRSPKPVLPAFDLQGQAVSDRIAQLLETPAPCMVARFGNTELLAVLNHLAVQEAWTNGIPIRRYLSGASAPWWWDDRTSREMIRGAGFFPPTPVQLERFARLALEDCTQIDILGSWLPGEQHVPNLNALRVPMYFLEPYRHTNPWSKALEGRSVLVVHPFAKSIRQQYAKRAQLFQNPNVLPKFDLQVFQAVQSIGGDCARFQDWFQALDWMKQEIAKLDFEIAIIGAGAYGMSLAAFIKRDLGRKAIHLGGATQILFGIKGRRWEAWPEYSVLFNDAWSRPLPDEVPPKAHRVEGGCYW